VEAQRWRGPPEARVSERRVVEGALLTQSLYELFLFEDQQVLKSVWLKLLVRCLQYFHIRPRLADKPCRVLAPQMRGAGLAFPSPLWGGVRGGGREVTRQRRRIFICLTIFPSPVPGEAAECRRRSAGEGPRRRRTLFRFVMTSRRGYSSGGIEAVDDASDVRRNTLAIPPYGLP